MHPDREPSSLSPEIEPRSFKEVVDIAISDYLACPAEVAQPKFTLRYLDKDDEHYERNLIGVAIDEAKYAYTGVTGENSSLNQMVLKLARNAENTEDLFHVIDHAISDQVVDRIQEYTDRGLQVRQALGTTSTGVARLMAKNAVKSDENTEQTIHMVFERLVDVDELKAERMKKMITHFEHALKRLFHDEDFWMTPEKAKRISDMAWSLEQAGLLKDEHDAQSLLGSPKTLQMPAYAEIMVARLTSKTIEVTSGEEEKSIWLAKTVLKDLLQRYAKDSTRHKANIELLLRTLYPSKARPESLSRQNLITVANQIIGSKNSQLTADEQHEKLDPHASGMVAPAVEHILSSTTANTATDKDYDEHRAEDQLYATLIGMLLEQRHYEKMRKASAR